MAGADVGINFTTQDFPGGSITVLDSTFSSVKTAIIFNTAPKKSPKQASLGLINVEYKDVGDIVFTGDSATGLRGGSGLLASWFIGNTFSDIGQGGGASASPSLIAKRTPSWPGRRAGCASTPTSPPAYVVREKPGTFLPGRSHSMRAWKASWSPRLEVTASRTRLPR